MAEPGPDARNLVGGHGGAYAAAADQNAAFGVATQNAEAHSLGKVRVVDRLSTVGSNVLKLMTAFLEIINQEFLEFEAGMIGANSNAHVLFLTSAEQCFKTNAAGPSP